MVIRINGLDRLGRAGREFPKRVRDGENRFLERASLHVQNIVREEVKDKTLHSRSGKMTWGVRRTINHSAGQALIGPTTRAILAFEEGMTIKPKGKAMVAPMRSVTKFPGRGIVQVLGEPGKDYFITEGETGSFKRHARKRGPKRSSAEYDYVEGSMLVMRKGIKVKKLEPVRKAKDKAKAGVAEIWKQEMGGVFPPPGLGAA